MKSPSMVSRSETYRKNALRNEEASKKAQEDKMFLILSDRISTEQLQEKCQVFLPDDYTDVTLERCIAGFCGYPLCTNKYTDNFGKRDFIIRRNTVYAIERRRNFCSDKCFEASDLILTQLSLTPPYLRNEEEIIVIDIPNLESLKGKKGDLKNIAGVDADLGDDDVRDTNASTEDIPDTIEDFAVAGLLSTADEIQQEESDQQEHTDHQQDQIRKNKPKNEKNVVKNLKPKTSHNENTPQDVVKDSNQLNSVNLDKKSKKNSKVKTKKDIVTDKSNDTEIKDDNEKSEKIHEEHPGLTLVKEVERYFLEWLTWDSFLVTFGDVYIKGLLNHHNLTYFEDKTLNEERDLKSPGDSLKYRLLCKRLDQEEKEEEELPVGGEEKGKAKRRPAKSVPDMGTLRNDVKNMTVKVSNFYSGSMDQNTAPSDEAEDEKSQGMTLPLIDQYDQTKRRYSLFMERINKEQRDVLPTLKLRTDIVRPLVSSLVKTFSLTRDNINVTPLQEPLVLLAILKLLSVRYTAIKCSLEECAVGEISPRLLVYGLDDKYLDRLLLFLTEERLVLAKYHLKYGIHLEKKFNVPETTENVVENESESTENVTEKGFNVPRVTVNFAENNNNKKLGALLESIATSDQSRLEPEAYPQLERDFQTLCSELETLD